MATNTTNYSLVKPGYSDTADIAVINGNMDKIDDVLDAVEKGIAIVSNNNTHAAITSGQFVYVRNHGSLAEGMYSATSNISANATLSASNLQAVASGGLNWLANAVNNLTGRIHTLALANNTSYALYNGATGQITTTESLDSYNYIVFAIYYNGRQQLITIRPGKTQTTTPYNLSFTSIGPSDNKVRTFVIQIVISGRYLSSVSMKYSYDGGAYNDFTTTDSVYIAAIFGYDY